MKFEPMKGKDKTHPNLNSANHKACSNLEFHGKLTWRNVPQLTITKAKIQRHNKNFASRQCVRIINNYSPMWT